MSAVTSCIVRARTVQEFLAAVDAAALVLCDANRNCGLWYRGQVQSGFQLLPSISRSIDGIPLNPELEIVFLSKFKSLATPYIDFPHERGKGGKKEKEKIARCLWQ